MSRAPKRAAADAGGADARVARVSHAGRVGAARGDLAGLAARTARLARQAGAHPVGLRRGGPPPVARRAGPHPDPRRGRRTDGPGRCWPGGRRAGPRRFRARADGPELDARHLPAVRQGRCGRGGGHELAVQRLGEVPQSQTRRRAAGPDRDPLRLAAVEADGRAGRQALARGAGGGRHRRQRRGHPAGDGGVSAGHGPGPQPGAVARRRWKRCWPTTWASAR